eukprot:SAG22_NODE_418_length_10750_cov_11.722280_5_plen_225_part_00
MTKYTNISRPGCWAYPDMLQVGNLQGPLAEVESRSHFGGCAHSVHACSPPAACCCTTHRPVVTRACAVFWHDVSRWCIVSSPLILGLDLTNETALGAVWEFITNTEAIKVNQAWAGDPGRLLNLSTAGPPDREGSSATVNVWAKALPEGELALLAINMGTVASTAVPVDLLAAAGFAGCGKRGCTARDVWGCKAAPAVGGGVWTAPALGAHDSAFVVLTSNKKH